MTRARQYATVVVVEQGRQVIHTTPRDSGVIVSFLSGSTLTALGAEYGITRERVRQLIARAGLSSKMRRRFASEENDSTRAWIARGQRLRAKVAQRLAQRRERRAVVVELVRWFVAEHGTTPTYDELGCVLWGEVENTTPRLLGFLGVGRMRRACRMLRAIYHTAGVEPRPLGFHGRSSFTGGST